ncbi:hypothetical protein [Pedosphaera parvula]|uniref:Transmembrane protein n=1 Tax=Pedosphaera parvula (strain Ellin514) TaxID=320771 RepID=B9XH26_PEDPL|nr:hypothetical protein [Pedosphaera parvula]EEF60947.1 hypothetical protein Cflav_PD4116 [Pedosphaera parvula Ellin514]
MTPTTKYPKEPAKAFFIVFFSLSALAAIMLPISVWTLAFGCCAFLAVTSVGLARLGRRVVLLLGLPFALAMLPGLIGVTLMLSSPHVLDAGESWLQVSRYLLYAWSAWGVCWVARGWLLYYREPHQTA